METHNAAVAGLIVKPWIGFLQHPLAVWRSGGIWHRPSTCVYLCVCPTGQPLYWARCPYDMIHLL